MAYQVIARKWRPQKFEEVTGQEAITQTLRNAIEHDRLHHAYLFSGARGVGKTTTARLLAKALNCHRTETPNPSPCTPSDPDACASCREVSESRSIDVLEFDAASNTQVDKIRDLIIENINISPARDRYKVFIIDEVHMLSTSSFNALLKTLEEPPPSVAFIMATTELHKVPDTIISRCQEFEFRIIATVKIAERLKSIASAEGINISEQALKEIAKSGEGSMRDAQSAFDQIISFSGESIDVSDVALALGLAGAELLKKIFDALAEKDGKAVLSIVDDLAARGHDFRSFCRDLQSFIRDLLVAKISDAEGLLDSAILSREELTTLSSAFGEPDLIRFFNSLSETETQLRTASQPRYILEIGLLKLIEMRRMSGIESLLERLAKLEDSIGSTPGIAPPPEKKTLKIDFPAEEIPFPIRQKDINPGPKEPLEPPMPEIDVSEPPFSESPVAIKDAPSFVGKPKLSFDASSMPLKLPPIAAEQLEHAEDDKLDLAYEIRLRKEGDDLLPIKNASGIISRAFGNLEMEKASALSASASASPYLMASAFEVPAFEEDIDASAPAQELPENPSEEELLAFAANHPDIRRLSRIFRAKITNVKKLDKK